MKMKEKEEFVEFLKVFREDLKQNPGNWENIDLSDFLEAMSRYTEDVVGYYDNTNQSVDAEAPSWQLFADILKGASIYE